MLSISGRRLELGPRLQNDRRLTLPKRVCEKRGAEEDDDDGGGAAVARTMQDIVKGWWLFNNEIRASGGIAEWSEEGWDKTTLCIEIKPSGIAPLKVSLNERPKADG